jgi:phosphinothricin acetyltransferase
MRIEFRDITDKDLGFVRDLFNHYILHTLKNYRIREMSDSDVREAVSPGHPVYRSQIILEDGESCGFIYLSQFRKREAYQRTAEITLYLKPAHTGRGIGRKAMEHMEALAAEKGIRVLVGIIGGDNRESIDFFSRMGFSRSAHFRGVAEKSGRVLDMVAYQKNLEIS